MEQAKAIWKYVLAFGLLLALSFLAKSAIWELAPQVFADSTGYLVPAVSLLDGRGYGAQENGFRTPTYPLALALLLAPLDHTHLSECRDAHRTVCIGQAAETADGQADLRAIALAHIALGVVTTALLFALGARLTHNALVGFVFGAAYALNIATAFWEISILTETVTTFLVTLAVYLTVRAERAGSWERVLLGAVLGALALCHSLFLVFWVMPGAYLLIRTWGTGWRTALQRIAPVVLIPLVGIGLWSSYNYFVNGFFTPSTLTGYVLIQMVGPVVQNAPEGYDGITQPYVGYRDAMIAETGSHSGAIFRAWPAMMEWTGFTWSEISNKLTALSMYLILHYPQTYLQVAAVGWERFWGFALYHYEPIPAGVPEWARWPVAAVESGGLNVLFGLAPVVLGVLFAAGRARGERRPRLPYGEILFICATVGYAALVSSATNFQDNARFHAYVLPLQVGAIGLVVWASWRTWRTLRAAHGHPPAGPGTLVQRTG